MTTQRRSRAREIALQALYQLDLNPDVAPDDLLTFVNGRLHGGPLVTFALGLVRGVWREVLGPEPEAPGPYAADWAEASGLERLAEAGARHFKPLAASDFEAGDVILFRWREGLPAKHAAIATSRQTMIHAHDGARVCEVRIGSLLRQRVAFAFQFPGLSD
jgi:NlpC/P60 family putative phage cell wall peptidase